VPDSHDLAARVAEYFEKIERTVFRGDPAANTKLRVEVLDQELVDDTPTLVLITPWTLNGMAFPPDDRFPEELTLGKRRYPVFRNVLDGIGTYFSVNLVNDVGNLTSPSAARSVAHPLGRMFREAVARARDQRTVADQERRDLLRGGGASG